MVHYLPFVFQICKSLTLLGRYCMDKWSQLCFPSFSTLGHIRVSLFKKKTKQTKKKQKHNSLVCCKTTVAYTCKVAEVSIWHSNPQCSFPINTASLQVTKQFCLWLAETPRVRFCIECSWHFKASESPPQTIIPVGFVLWMTTHCATWTTVSLTKQWPLCRLPKQQQWR